NNYSIAGDFNFNDYQPFNIGYTYDLQSVAMHELGHTLGLDHSVIPGTVMLAVYGGTKRALSSDDVNGIQAIYGARQADPFDAAGSNGSFATASVLTSS